MKELNSCNYELISGGIPPIVVAMAIGAGSGVASHIGSKIYSGEEITASGILASGIGRLLVVQQVLHTELLKQRVQS
ncbi:hypothetical protein [Gallibacterium anatis]|uniref:hypothetical protein n=1 Tax=Gallibacterium anatis TaxID=750 RepID=UPI003005DFEC